MDFIRFNIVKKLTVNKNPRNPIKYNILIFLKIFSIVLKTPPRAPSPNPTPGRSSSLLVLPVRSCLGHTHLILDLPSSFVPSAGDREILYTLWKMMPREARRKFSICTNVIQNRKVSLGQGFICCLRPHRRATPRQT